MFEKLMAAFKSATSSAKPSESASEALSVLDTISSSLSSLVNKLDKLLKTKGIDIETSYKNSKKTISDIISNNTFSRNLTKVYEEVKAKEYAQTTEVDIEKGVEGLTQRKTGPPMGLLDHSELITSTIKTTYDQYNPPGRLASIFDRGREVLFQESRIRKIALEKNAQLLMPKLNGYNDKETARYRLLRLMHALTDKNYTLINPYSHEPIKFTDNDEFNRYATELKNAGVFKPDDNSFVEALALTLGNYPGWKDVDIHITIDDVLDPESYSETTLNSLQSQIRDKSDLSANELKIAKAYRSLVNIKNRILRTRGGVDPELDEELAERKATSFSEKIKSAIGRMFSFTPKSNDPEDEKDPKRDKDKSPGLLSSLVKGVGGVLASVVKGLGGVLLSGLGSAITGAIGLGFKLLTSTLSGLFGKLIPMLTGGITGAAGAILKGGAKVAGKAAWGAIKAVPSVAATAGRLALPLLANPVTLTVAAVGAAAYAGYKGYQYLTRNDLPDGVEGKLARLRLLSYGVSEKNKDKYHRFLKLEAIAESFLVNKNNNFYVSELDQEAIEEVTDIFSIDTKDESQVKMFESWYTKRFVPAYLAFIRAMNKAMPNSKIVNLKSFRDSHHFTLLSNLTIPSSVFEVSFGPSSDLLELDVTKPEYDNLLKETLVQIKAKLDKGQDKSISRKEVFTSFGARYDAVTGTAKLLSPASLPTYGKTPSLATKMFFGGYSLYKKMTTESIKDDIYGKFAKLRLLSYGVDSTMQDSYYKFLSLESLLSIYIKEKSGRLYVDDMSDEDKETMLDIFGIDYKETAKVELLRLWLVKRFIPAYLAFISAMRTVIPNVKIENLKVFKSKHLYDLATKLTIPGSVFEFLNFPTSSDFKLLDTKLDFDNLLKVIVAETKTKTEKEVTQEELERIEKKNKEYITSKQAESDKVNPPIPERPPVKPPIRLSDKGSDEKDGNQLPSNNSSEKAPGSVKTAPGELVPGGSSLDGIVTNLPKEKIYNLDPNVRELFTGMVKEYNSLTGKDITVNEAFRSFEDQKALYEANPAKAAKPGNSTHEFGLAIDIPSSQADELENMGLMRKYGFTRPIGGEKWHLEPIGVSIDPNKAKADQSFRFNAVQTSIGRGGDGYGTLEDSVLKKRNQRYQYDIFKAKETAVGQNDRSPMDSLVASSSPKMDTSTTNIPGTVQSDRGKPNDQTTTVNGNGPSGKPNIGTTSIPANNSTVTPNNGTYTSTPINKPTVASVTSGNNGSLDIGKYTSISPEQAIKQASQVSGIPVDVLTAFAKIESNLVGDARSNSSSATGLFQITKPTWDDLIKRYGDSYNIPTDAPMTNNYYNAVLASLYAKENLAKLGNYQAAGIEQGTALYLAHHFGVSGANNIINSAIKVPEVPVRSVVSDRVYQANRQELGNNTVEGYVEKVENKVNTAMGVTTKVKDTQGDQTSGLAKASLDSPRPLGGTSKGGYASSVSSTPPIMSSKPKVMEPIVAQPSTPVNTPKSEPVKQPSVALNTDKMESILTQQLGKLSEIADILRGMSSIKPQPSQPEPQKGNLGLKVDNSVSPNAVDLTRKELKV